MRYGTINLIKNKTCCVKKTIDAFGAEIFKWKQSRQYTIVRKKMCIRLKNIGFCIDGKTKIQKNTEFVIPVLKLSTIWERKIVIFRYYKNIRFPHVYIWKMLKKSSNDTRWEIKQDFVFLLCHEGECRIKSPRPYRWQPFFRIHQKSAGGVPIRRGYTGQRQLALPLGKKRRVAGGTDGRGRRGGTAHPSWQEHSLLIDWWWVVGVVRWHLWRYKTSVSNRGAGSNREKHREIFPLDQEDKANASDCNRTFSKKVISLEN